jgi:hypothetical protein
MQKHWYLLALPLLAACSGNDSDESGNPGDSDTTVIASTPLSGKINGKEWTFQSGQTDAFLSDGDPNFWTALYAETFPACEGIPDHQEPELILNIPRQAGTYRLSLALNATFAFERGTESENLVATKGKLVVDEVTSTQIRAGAFVEYDANNSVNGQFQVSVCAD